MWVLCVCWTETRLTRCSGCYMTIEGIPVVYFFFPHQLQFKKKKSCSCPQRRQKWVFDHHRFLVRVLFLHGIPCNPSWRDYTETTIRTSLEVLTIFVSFVCFLLSGCLLWYIFTPETWSKMDTCSYLINKLKGHCGNIWSWAQMKFSFLRPVYHLRKKQKMLWMRCNSKTSVHVLAFMAIKKGLRDLVSQGRGPDFLCSAVDWVFS